MFLKDKRFWLNFSMAITSVFLIVNAGFFSLEWYTRHNQDVRVINVTGMKYTQAKKELESQGLKVELVDSSFEIPVNLENTGIAPGDVISQNPKPSEKVKKGRKVYLTICTLSLPMIEMPNLVNLSIRQAQNRLESNGLILNPANTNSDWPVAEQWYNDKRIEPGTMVPRGSVITVIADTVFTSK